MVIQMGLKILLSIPIHYITPEPTPSEAVMGRQAHPAYLDSPFHRKRSSIVLSGLIEIGCRDLA